MHKISMPIFNLWLFNYYKSFCQCFIAAQVTKQYQDCKREKDMMVVRFAEAEGKTLESRKMVTKWENKVKDVLREKENMVAAVKAANADRQKALANQDAKVSLDYCKTPIFRARPR